MMHFQSMGGKSNGKEGGTAGVGHRRGGREGDVTLGKRQNCQRQIQEARQDSSLWPLSVSV